MATSADHDDLITHFCSLTGAGPEEVSHSRGFSYFDIETAD